MHNVTTHGPTFDPQRPMAQMKNSWQEPSPGEEDYAKDESYQSLLLSEITHRFKNELTSIIGVLSLASIRSKDADARRLLEDTLNTLDDQVRLHRVLQMPRDNGVSDASSYLRSLLTAFSRAKLERSGVRMVYRESAPVICSAMRCWLLGVIVSELVTNSLKHASREPQVIGVELVAHDDEITCRVSDKGSGAVRIREGNGLRIVRSLARTLGGKVHHECGPQGTVSIVSIPRAPAMGRSTFSI